MRGINTNTKLITPPADLTPPEGDTNITPPAPQSPPEGDSEGTPPAPKSPPPFVPPVIPNDPEDNDEDDDELEEEPETPLTLYVKVEGKITVSARDYQHAVEKLQATEHLGDLVNRGNVSNI